MTGLDWLIVAFAGLSGLFGLRQGFIVGLLSLVGFAAGAFLGTRLGPLLLPQGSSSPYAPVFGLFGAVLLGTIMATSFQGVALRARRALALSGLRVLDGVFGAIFSVVIGLGIVWIAAAVVAQVPQLTKLRVDIQRSLVLRELNDLLPPSGSILNALARLDPLPQIQGPTPGVAPPPPEVARSPAIRAAAHSVVRVIGTACGLAVEGSGWVAGSDVVLTNAHVVAGESETLVQVGGHQPDLPAQAIAFDPRDDLAVLRVQGLDLPPLRLVSNPPSGASGAILGYPENGPLDAQAGRIGQTQNVVTDNAYGEGPVTRLLTPLRGVVRPGNSGGPLVGTGGEVLTTVFAGTTGAGPRGGYGVANSTASAVLAGAGRTVSTGRCV